MKLYPQKAYKVIRESSLCGDHKKIVAQIIMALIMWAGNTLRDGIQAEIERQLAPPKEKLDTDQKKA